MHLLLLRHGQTEWNRDGRMQGQGNSQLTKLGLSQAQTQGRILRSLNLSDTVKYVCSPLGRTRQTAAHALAHVQAEIVIDPRVQELGVGSWEGCDRDAVIAAHPEIFQTDLSVLERFCASPDGEGYNALHARLSDFLGDIGQPTVVVSHGIAISVLRGLVRGLSFADIANLDHPQGKVIEIKDGIEKIHSE